MSLAEALAAQKLKLAKQSIMNPLTVTQQQQEQSQTTTIATTTNSNAQYTAIQPPNINRPISRFQQLQNQIAAKIQATPIMNKHHHVPDENKTMLLPILHEKPKKPISIYSQHKEIQIETKINEEQKERCESTAINLQPITEETFTQPQHYYANPDSQYIPPPPSLSEYYPPTQTHSQYIPPSPLQDAPYSSARPASNASSMERHSKASDSTYIPDDFDSASAQPGRSAGISVSSARSYNSISTELLVSSAPHTFVHQSVPTLNSLLLNLCQNAKESVDMGLRLKASWEQALLHQQASGSLVAAARIKQPNAAIKAGCVIPEVEPQGLKTSLAESQDAITLALDMRISASRAELGNYKSILDEIATVSENNARARSSIVQNIIAAETNNKGIHSHAQTAKDVYQKEVKAAQVARARYEKVYVNENAKKKEEESAKNALHSAEQRVLDLSQITKDIFAEANAKHAEYRERILPKYTEQLQQCDLSTSEYARDFYIRSATRMREIAQEQVSVAEQILDAANQIDPKADQELYIAHHMSNGSSSLTVPWQFTAWTPPHAGQGVIIEAIRTELRKNKSILSLSKRLPASIEEIRDLKPKHRPAALEACKRACEILIEDRRKRVEATWRQYNTHKQYPTIGQDARQQSLQHDCEQFEAELQMLHNQLDHYNDFFSNDHSTSSDGYSNMDERNTESHSSYSRCYSHNHSQNHSLNNSLNLSLNQSQRSDNFRLKNHGINSNLAPLTPISTPTGKYSYTIARDKRLISTTGHSPQEDEVEAAYDYVPETNEHGLMLAMTDGETFKLIAKADDNWYEVQNSSGAIGLIPVTYCHPLNS